MASRPGKKSRPVKHSQAASPGRPLGKGKTTGKKPAAARAGLGLLESFHEAVLIASAEDFKIMAANPAACALYGYNEKELCSLDLVSLCPPAERELARSKLLRQTRGPKEFQHRRKDGTPVSVEFDPAECEYLGRRSLLCVVHDISTRAQLVRALLESDAMHREIIENARDIIYTHDLKGNFTSGNRAVARILGYTRDELLQLNIRDVVFAEDLPRALEAVRTKAAGEPVTPPYILRVVTKDGITVPLEVNTRLIFREGAAVGIQGIARDISDRIRVEAALRESEAKFRAVAESAPCAILIYQGSRLRYVNPTTEHLTGYSAVELMALKEFWELAAPEFREIIRERSLARQKGEPVSERYEFKIIHKSGEDRWMDFTASRITFEGHPAVLVMVFDITEKMRAEAEVRDSEDRFRQLFEKNLAGVFVSTIDGKITDCNDSFARIFGYGSRQEVLAHNARDLYMSDEDRSAFVERIRKAGAFTNLELMCRRKDGTPIWVLENVGLLDFVPGQPERIQGTLIDITERKYAEQALIESESKFRAVADTAASAIYIHNGKRFLYVNRASEDISGYTATELLVLNPFDIVHSEDIALVMARARARQEGDGAPDRYEFRIIRKDGSPRWLDFSASVIQFEGQSALLCTAFDITERRGLEDQLRQAQKMEAVGRLAGGIAHDFNNLLTVIKGYSELLLEEFPEGLPLRGEVEEIKRAADRAATLTKQLLAFSRQQVLAPKVLDLNSVVGNMDKLLRRLLGADIMLVTSLDPSIGRVKADPGQVEQVIMNLAVNARDAMPHGGKLTIETAGIELDEAYTREHVGSRPGRYVMLTVADSGTGMSEEVRQRIFEPFFTTKESGKGTGLGLSTVYGIVKQSQGYIWVDSAAGKGSAFKVYLPQLDAPTEVTAIRTVAQSSFRGEETVLLVEDEDGVRALVRQVLHKQGYTVLEARHGGEAILQCERHPGEIHLLLTDVVLEGIGGPELAGRLLKMRPDMKVLFISGYTDDAIIHHGVETSSTAFLQKPFTTDTLARKIRQVLAGAEV